MTKRQTQSCPNLLGLWNWDLEIYAMVMFTVHESVKVDRYTN